MVNLLRRQKYYQPSLAQMKALIDNIGQHNLRMVVFC
jgi:hypothetical protein